MIPIVGVRFRQAGKVYYFDPKEFSLDRGSHVIVETSRGVEYGTVIIPPKEVPDDEVVLPLKEVIRIASAEDDEREATNRMREREAYLICQEKILAHNLDMKLVQAEYTFDGNKLLFYFTADGRIDFRDLVKDLAGIFRTRIELRQIGVRDETKLLGGIGICGRPLCCHTFLSDFAPVSIKMAKEQNLSLNPTKISGTCGRLMCCLKNEQETYEYLNSTMPRMGEWVTTEEGFRGEVSGTNVLRQLVKVVIDNGEEKEIREYHVDQLRFRGKRRKDQDAEPGREPSPEKHREKSPEKHREKNREKGREKNREKSAEVTVEKTAEKDLAHGEKERSKKERNSRNRRRNRNHRDRKGGKAGNHEQ